MSNISVHILNMGGILCGNLLWWHICPPDVNHLKFNVQCTLLNICQWLADDRWSDIPFVDVCRLLRYYLLLQMVVGYRVFSETSAQPPNGLNCIHT